MPVPREVDLEYAVASALVGRAIRARARPEAREVIGHVLTYAGRFPEREMGVMLVTDLYRAVGQDIFGVPQFQEWASRVADVMLYEH